jgi:hypothetical protein
MSVVVNKGILGSLKEPHVAFRTLYRSWIKRTKRTAPVSAPIPPAQTFNAAQKSANIVLSNSDLTARANNAGAADYNVRAGALIVGKTYIEVLVNDVGASIEFGIGFSVDGLSVDTYIGSSAASIGWYKDGKIYRGAVIIATLAGYITGDRLMCTIDPTTGNISFGKNGSWITAAPDVATTITLPAASTYRFALNMGASIVAQASIAPMIYPIPSGYAAF